MNWMTALKKYNEKFSNVWVVPKKGTEGYENVKNIMNGKKPKKSNVKVKSIKNDLKIFLEAI